MNPSHSRKTSAKIKFLALYLLSVVLIVVLLSSFLRPVAMPVPGSKKPVEKSRVMEIDALLHKATDRYQGLTEKAGGVDADRNTALVEKEILDQLTLADGLRGEIADWKDDQEKEEAGNLLKSFVRNLQWQSRLVSGSKSPVRDTVIRVVNGASPETAQLKTLLQQKEAAIATLERNNKLALEERDKIITTLRNRPASQPAAVVQKQTAGAVEWMAKYNKLKASSDKNNTLLNNLQSSYREVIADNRRLLTQLQTLKEGKN